MGPESNDAVLIFKGLTHPGLTMGPESNGAVLIFRG